MYCVVRFSLRIRRETGKRLFLFQPLTFCRPTCERPIKEHQNAIIKDPTGVSKTWLACALAHKVCRYTVHSTKGSKAAS